MIPTKKGTMPRILVRISGADRHENKTEKKILTNDGKELTLFLAPLSEDIELRKHELAVQVGEVIGLGADCEEYQVGDTVLMDYNIDSDEQYLVTMEGKDKIVCVPSRTTYHEEAYSITSYGRQISEREYVKTGERNMLIWDCGDINELGLIYAIIRKAENGFELIPNDYWIFCEHQPERSENMEAINGIMAYRQYDDTHVTRKVLYCGPDINEFQPGDTVLAIAGAAIPVAIHDVKFDVIARPDIFCIELPE